MNRPLQDYIDCPEELIGKHIYTFMGTNNNDGTIRMFLTIGHVVMYVPGTKEWLILDNDVNGSIELERDVAIKQALDSCNDEQLPAYDYVSMPEVGHYKVIDMRIIKNMIRVGQDKFIVF